MRFPQAAQEEEEGECTLDVSCGSAPQFVELQPRHGNQSKQSNRSRSKTQSQFLAGDSNTDDKAHRNGEGSFRRSNMAPVAAVHRELGWNVLLSAQGLFAGFFQKDGLVKVGDVRRELDLCFLSEDPWQPVLLSSDAPQEVMFILDLSDTTAFPTPAANQRASYDYAFHDPDCRTPSAGHLITSGYPLSSHTFK
jgi:hypothetical protein